MPSDLTTTIESLFDRVINQGDLDAADEVFATTFVSHSSQGNMDIQGFKDYVTNWRAGFPDVRCEVQDPIESGDRIAWRIRATGTHEGEFMGIPATGRQIDFDSMNHARAEDGRIVEHWMVMDVMTMLEQLGAIPAAAGGAG
jgi:steroid delta-isomerase-like uncharacterized protein